MYHLYKVYTPHLLEISMKNLNEEQVIEFIENSKTMNDIVTFLSMTLPNTKTEIRTEVERIMVENGLAVQKKESKSGALKAWFLDQPNPLDVTKDQIKKMCNELEMKGGSVTYYVSAYTLAIELTNKIDK